jgi:hypothetical protein
MKSLSKCRLLCGVLKISSIAGIAAAVTLPLGLRAQTNCVPVPSGLVSWWRAEGNGNDSVNGNTAVLLNGTSFTNGEVGQGFSFDGASDEIIVSNSPTVNFGTNDFTIEGWIKAFPNATTYNVNTIIDKRYNQTIGYEFTLESGSLHLRISSTPGSGGFAWTTGPDLRDGTFHHVAVSVTRSSTNGMAFYVDGAVVGTADPTSQQGSLSNSAVMMIGEHSAGLNTYFDGVIDELSLYGRALAAAEVQAIFAADGAGKCHGGTNCVPPASGLVAWWPMQSNAVDVVGGHNGTLAGTYSFAAGEVGLSLNASGTNAGASVADSADLNFGPGVDFSIELWTRPQVATTAYGAMGLIDKRIVPNVSQSMGYVLAVGNGQLAFQMSDSLNKPFLQTAPVGPDLRDGVWHHVAVTVIRGASDGGKLYVDGQAVGTFDPTSQQGDMTTTAPLLIGLAPASLGLDTNLRGGVDEPSIYRRALSGAEILAIYNAGSAGKCAPAPPTNCVPPASGLVGWWKGEGNALDVVGGYNGALSGGVTFALGEVGRAFNFDGTGEVSIPSAPALNVQSFTVETWVNPSKVDANVDTILNKENDSAVTLQDTSYELGIRGAADPGNGSIPAGHLAFFIGGIAGLPSDYGGWVDGGGDVPTNVWTHCALSYDGAAARVYVNGVLTRSISGLSGTPSATSGPFKIGSRGTSQVNAAPLVRFNGLIDEVSLYSRSLSAAEVQAIYNAGSGGKCATPIAPFIVTQPASQTLTAGANASFSVVAGGTSPLSYQWKFNGANISGATASSYTIASAQTTNSGNYSVAITNSVNYVISSNAMLTVNPGPSLLRVGSNSVASGGTVTVPVFLTASGSENALSFSLNFATNRLTYAGAQLASGSGPTLFLNESQTAAGRLGVVLVLPTGETFPPGAQGLIEVTFKAGIVLSPTSTPITFADQPVVRQVSDATGNVLTATYTPGSVAIAAVAYEADVSPRPTGNQAVTVTDVVLIGRFAARLDSPTNAGEFQRADCAPRATLGNGRISIADWVQAGRYAAGLDPLTPVGGPTSPVPPTSTRVGSSGPKPLIARQVALNNTTLNQGQSGTISVNLLSQGDENGLGFSLSFDSVNVSYMGATLGSGARGAALNVNTNEASAGRVGFALALGSGANFAPGMEELVKVTFQASAAATSSVSIVFGDDPIYREVSDAGASELTANYLGTAITVNPVPLLTISQTDQGITLTWPSWATNYALQQSDSSVNSPANWTNSSATVTTTGNQSSATVPIESTSTFYRLLKQ